MREKPSGKPRLGAWNRLVLGWLGAVLVVELERRVGTVAGRVERRSLDEPGVALGGPIKPANWPGMIRPVL